MRGASGYRGRWSIWLRKSTTAYATTSLAGMPATTAPTQSIALNQKLRVTVAAFAAADGSLDTTTPLTVSVTAGANAAIASVDPNDNRKVIIAGNNVVGSATVRIGVAGTTSPVDVPVTVTTPVNYSHVDFVEASAPEPK